ncbi:MAG TPA: hypothetical protein HPP66_06555 [Planctomycetes bacterium]|nr:hypothetical protein [Planctomycetota bacterium]
MSLKDFCNNVANHMGLFAGKSRNVLLSAQKKLKESTNLPEKIRNSIFEKLSRSLARQAEFLVGKISERMEVIDEVSQPFYEKINALKACGPVSESQLWEAMNSIEAARKLADEEKVLLVNLFGQIVGAQKSKVVDAVVVENDNSANRKSKARLNAGTNR